MTALQRISASFKRRRNSLFERSNQREFEDEEQTVLDEAKSFINQNNGLGVEELKMLHLLCDMLENSLQFARQERDRTQMTIDKNDRSERGQTQGGVGYTTWVAGGTQGQRHRKLLIEKLESALNKTAVDMGTIHEEEHEHATNISAIATTTDGGTMERGINLAEMEEIMKMPGDAAQLVFYEEPEPLHVIILPHVALILTAIVYMLGGSLIYRWIDPVIGAKSSARAFIWAFQLLATIGWGDSHASNTLSQAFTVLYILLGIPILFSAYANFGRLITEFFCKKGPEIWNKLSGNVDKEEKMEEVEIQRFPLVVIANLLAFHQCAGLLIYSFWLKDWPVISTIYFSITTMATSGFGDFHPDTDSWIETIVAVIYISIGIVLLSALFLTIALYYQAFNYIQLKELLAQLYERYLRSKNGRKIEKEEGKQENHNG